MFDKYIMKKIETYDIETENTNSLCLIDPIMLTGIVLIILIIIYFMNLKDEENQLKN
jgi:hypothetical protein